MLLGIDYRLTIQYRQAVIIYPNEVQHSVHCAGSRC